jgi:hypothetical protein
VCAVPNVFQSGPCKCGWVIAFLCHVLKFKWSKRGHNALNLKGLTLANTIKHTKVVSVYCQR